MPYPVFDLHCDTADRLAWQTLPQTLRQACGMDFYGPGDAENPAGIRALDANHGHISLAAIGATPWAQCFACYIPDALSPEVALAFWQHVTGWLTAEVDRLAPAVRVAQAAADIRPALGEGRTVAVHTIENARFFALDPALVDEAAAAGVLMASLTWNAPGPLASGHDDKAAGLTATGKAVLARMENARMIVDVSHLNDRSFADVARATDRPLVASHSNSRAVCGHPRNLTDDQFAEIRARGGLVGLNFADVFLADDAPARTPGFDDIARHLEHWLDLGGEDVIALGSDFDGCDTPPVVGTAAAIPAFQDLVARRFGADIAARLCAGNALAFFERAAR